MLEALLGVTIMRGISLSSEEAALRVRFKQGEVKRGVSRRERERE